MSYRKEGIYLCTKSWQNIHEADRYLLNISHESIINDETLTISDQPIFLTHTSLVDDFSSIGKVSYRLIVIKVSEIFSVNLISD